jgi:hypothetical protein
MIRPITLVCFLLACASGLYLYQEKHRVQMIDRDIEKTVHATETIREQTRVLHAEWTLLNDPQRLQSLADQFLSLKTVTPGQFTSLAELDNRLPPVRPPEPPQPPQQVLPSASAPIETPVAQQEQPEPAPETPAIAAVAPPPSPADKPATAAVALARPVDRKPAPVAKPQLAAAASPMSAPRSEPKPAERRPVLAEVTRPPPRTVPVAAPPPIAAVGGSSLGMAHGTFVPPPRPMPVNASQWSPTAGGGGG